VFETGGKEGATISMRGLFFSSELPSSKIVPDDFFKLFSSVKLDVGIGTVSNVEFCN
jgi:hypothetical protein